MRVCPRCEKKTARAINIKVGGDVIHAGPSACVDSKVKRSKDKVSVLSSVNQAGQTWVCMSIRLRVFSSYQFNRRTVGDQHFVRREILFIS